MKSYREISTSYHAGFAALANDVPDTIAAFGSLMQAATQQEALSLKTKELIAFAIAITVRCDGCIGHHAESVLKAGATRQEVAEMIGIAILMGGGPSTVYGVEAMRAFEEFSATNQ